MSPSIGLSAAAAGVNDVQIARRLRTSRPTVAKWLTRFQACGLDGLDDEVRSGRPRTVRDPQVAAFVQRTLPSTPAEATQWSTRSMAAAGGVSRETVRRIWRAFGLQPHRAETFTLRGDPLLLEKTRDICGLYLSPPDLALVLSIDEKTQIQALERSRALFPMPLGQAERRIHHKARHGITRLFAALDVAGGTVIGQCDARHRHEEFLRILRLVDHQVPPLLDVHLTLDNDGPLHVDEISQRD